MKFILGLQNLLVVYFGGAAANQFFGTGFVGSVAFGSLPAFLIFSFAYGIFPRLFLVLMTGCWAFVGYSLVGGPTASLDAAAGGALIGGLLGLGANWAQAFYFRGIGQASKAEQVDATQAASLDQQDYDDDEYDDDPDLSEYDESRLAAGIDHLVRARAIKLTTARRAMSKLSPDVAERDLDRVEMKDLEREYPNKYSEMHAGELSEAGLLSREGLERALAILDQKREEMTEEGVEELRVEQDRSAKDAARQLKAARDAGEIDYMSGHLFDLAYCRAITMNTFARAMMKVDPDYDITRARIEFFPETEPPADAKTSAKELFEVGAITLDELHDANDQIDARMKQSA